MEDVFEWAEPFEHTLDLAEFTNVTTSVVGFFDVRPQAEANLVGLMMKVARHHVMTARTQFFDQACTDYS
jgi:hypothetical protein